MTPLKTIRARTCLVRSVSSDSLTFAQRDVVELVAELIVDYEIGRVGRFEVKEGRKESCEGRKAKQETYNPSLLHKTSVGSCAKEPDPGRQSCGKARKSSTMLSYSRSDM